MNILSTLISDRRRHRRGSPATTSSADPAAVRAAIGVTGQFSAVDGLLTGAENLRLMADLHHLRRADGRSQSPSCSSGSTCGTRRASRSMTYSGGMKRKLDLAMTLIARPRCMFLDEPTTGLDPRSRREVWDIVRGLVADGVTILLTTQYLDEADHLADRIAVLDGGRIVAHDEPSRLKRQVPGGRIRLHFAGPSAVTDARSALAGTWFDATDPGTARRRRACGSNCPPPVP